MSDETPLPSGKITMDEASWIVSYVYIGGIIGNMMFGYITNRFGRKWPLIIITIPIIVIVVNYTLIRVIFGNQQT